jgi:hypothetical protein
MLGTFFLWEEWLQNPFESPNNKCSRFKNRPSEADLWYSAFNIEEII